MTSFNYYICQFILGYTSGNLFLNAVAMEVSEIVAYLISGAIAYFIGF